jgi:hypothetical protein
MSWILILIFATGPQQFGPFADKKACENADQIMRKARYLCMGSLVQSGQSVGTCAVPPTPNYSQCINTTSEPAKPVCLLSDGQIIEAKNGLCPKR